MVKYHGYNAMGKDQNHVRGKIRNKMCNGNRSVIRVVKDQGYNAMDTDQKHVWVTIRNIMRWIKIRDGR